MGEETRMNLDTSYYNGEKTEYTVDHRTMVTSSMMVGDHVKYEASVVEVENMTHFGPG